MNAKRRAREREALKSALNAIALKDGLCADCPTAVYHLRWADDADRWKVDTSHPPTCMVRRSRWFEHLFGTGCVPC